MGNLLLYTGTYLCDINIWLAACLIYVRATVLCIRNFTRIIIPGTFIYIYIYIHMHW